MDPVAFIIVGRSLTTIAGPSGLNNSRIHPVSAPIDVGVSRGDTISGRSYRSVWIADLDSYTPGAPGFIRQVCVGA